MCACIDIVLYASLPNTSLLANFAHWKFNVCAPLINILRTTSLARGLDILLQVVHKIMTTFLPLGSILALKKWGLTKFMQARDELAFGPASGDYKS